ncbi:MAG: hypothetical protein WD690_11130 [Vicinamibacterales bacterium]
MKAWALIDGFRRALRAWPMALMLSAFTLLPAPALVLRDRLSAADFGIGGFPFNISASAYYTYALAPSQRAMLALLFLIWLFLSAGIIDRLARDTRSSAARFFAACGGCFGPLIRLGLLALLVYSAVLRWIEPWMASQADGLAETSRLALFGALAIVLFLIAIVFDYARLRLVIEDRRSAIGAVLASVRMLRAFGGRMLAVQAAFWLLLLLWITLRTQTADAAPAWLIYAFVTGDMLLRLSLIGAQASIYQAHLGSAGWVARRDPIWPDEASANPAAI